MNWKRVVRSALLASAVTAIAYSYSTVLQAQMPSPISNGLPQAQVIGKLEEVARFNGPMLTGVTVSRSGRVFVNFPKWGDPVQYTVAEVKNGQTTAFPNAEFNQPEGKDPAKALISVQSVVVDQAIVSGFWTLAAFQFGPTQYGGPKLVGVDLQQNRIVKTILFPREVALPTTYLNDVRFDLRRGKAGMAFITDSSDKGPNGIIVVDLETGKSWRRLNDHPSTKAEPNFLPVVEGQPILERQPGQPPKHLKLGSDGIAISADGKRLFYCALASRTLYSVSVDALANEQLSDAQVAATVTNHGDKGGGSDGLETDAQNRLYLTNYEQNGITRRLPNGTYEPIVYDPRALWPDTLSVAADGYLYFTANQLHRQARFQNGKDLRQKPYSVFRVKIDAQPIALK